MNWKIFRIGMMVFTTMWILFGVYTIHYHVIKEGLIILFVGIGGLIFFSFRLGRYWKGEQPINREVKS